MDNISPQKNKRKTYPNQVQVREAFEYAEGYLIWAHRPISHFKSTASSKRWNNVWAGRIAGAMTDSGYMKTSLSGFGNLLIHRLVWIYHNGDIPLGLDIDHDDRVRHNNSISNLSLMTNAKNHRNIKRRIDNKSGVTGVFWCTQANKWRTDVRVPLKKSVYLGVFTDLNKAAEVVRRFYEANDYHDRHGLT